MTSELKEAFEKAKKIIYDKKELMVDSLPVVHELEDGILIKFFSKWEDCEHEKIKIKKISSLDNEHEKIYLGFLPKGIKIKARTNDFLECFILLDGQITIDVEGDIKSLEAFTKMCIKPQNNYSGEAFKDSYVIIIGCNQNCE
jgi:hypothetical protein